jgi:ParB-like chromosome segregation protein Spo0J
MSAETEQPAERCRYPLERPWIRWRLVRELAEKTHTRATLARRYGVTRSSMTEFAQRHAADIEAVERQIEDEMAGLWIAQKRNRVAVYQQNVEDIAALVDRDIDPKTAPRKTSDDNELIIVGAKLPSLLRVQAQILRNVAEELGQLTVRVEDVPPPPAIDPRTAALIAAARERNERLLQALATTDGSEVGSATSAE